MAHYWLGLSYYHTGALSKSLESYSVLHDKGPDKTLGLYQMSVALKASGKYKESINCLKKIIKVNPELPSVHYHLGRSYMGISENELAIEEFKTVMKLNPIHRDATRRLKELANDDEMYSFEVAPLYT